MALDENLEEVVGILTRFYNGQQEALRDTYGEQAPMMADEMGEMLGEMLMSETPFSQLWLEFVDDPITNEAELIGALEMLEETIPVLAIRLEGYYAGFLEMRNQDEEIVESTEPEDHGVAIEEIESIKSIDDGDDDDEYREDTTYLVGNVEDRSTSAMYYEDLDTSIEPNESEDD